MFGLLAVSPRNLVYIALLICNSGYTSKETLHSLNIMGKHFSCTFLAGCKHLNTECICKMFSDNIQYLIVSCNIRQSAKT